MNSKDSEFAVFKTMADYLGKPYTKSTAAIAFQVKDPIAVGDITVPRDGWVVIEGAEAQVYTDERFKTDYKPTRIRKTKSRAKKDNA